MEWPAVTEIAQTKTILPIRGGSGVGANRPWPQFDFFTEFYHIKTPFGQKVDHRRPFGPPHKSPGSVTAADISPDNLRGKQLRAQGEATVVRHTFEQELKLLLQKLRSMMWAWV